MRAWHELHLPRRAMISKVRSALKVPRIVKLCLRALVAALLYWLLFRSLDVPTITRHLHALAWPWLALGFALPIIGIPLSAYRWQQMLSVLGVKLPYRDAVRRYWASSFYNTVLPGSVGGDVIRIAGLTRSGVPIATGSLSVLADRALGLGLSVLIGLLGALWPSDLPHRFELGSIFGVLLLAGIAGVLAWPWLARRLPNRVRAQLVPVPILRFLHWRIVSLAALFQLLVVLHMFACAKALGLPVSLLMCSLYMPAVVLSTLLPFSINGIGIRETALVALLAGVGVKADAGILLGLLVTISSIFSTLPGSIGLLGLRTQVTHDSPVSAH